MTSPAGPPTNSDGAEGAGVPAGATPGHVELHAGQPTAFNGFEQLQVRHSQFPPPWELERYEALLPGAFNRILTLVEQQQQAEIRQNDLADQYRHRDVRRAHYLGAGVTILAMGCALVLAHMGQIVLAGAFISVTVLSIAKALIDSIRPRARSEADTPDA